MSIPYIIAYTNVFIWLIPPFRQYRTKFFYFFLILGLTDPVIFIFWRLFEISPRIIYPLSALFLILTLLKYDYKKIIAVLFFAFMLILFDSKLNDKQLDIFYSFINL